MQLEESSMINILSFDSKSFGPNLIRINYDLSWNPMRIYSEVVPTLFSGAYGEL